MKKAGHIQELHDKPLETSYERLNAQTDMYSFSVGGHTYKSIFMNSSDTFEEFKSKFRTTVSFDDIVVESLRPYFNGRRKKISYYGFVIDKDHDPYYDKTSHTGNEFLVLSTVIDTIVQQVAKGRMDALVFGSRDINSTEKSKYVAYRGIVQRLQKKYGFDYIECKDSDLAIFLVDVSSHIKESSMKEEANMIPQQMQQDLSKQIQKDPSAVVNSAFDQAVKNINPSSAEQWNQVIAQTTAGLGLARDQNPSISPASPSAQTLQTPVSPLAQAPAGQAPAVQAPVPGQASILPAPAPTITTKGTPPPTYPKYEATSLDFDRVATTGETKAMTKFELATQIIKDLKKKKVADNDIIFALVNRVYIDVETAKKILDKEMKAKDAIPSGALDQNPKSMSGLAEDNVYNHMHITTNNNYPYSSYQFDTNRDPFEFELNSTQLVARAIIVDQRYEFEARFEVVRSNLARWPHCWMFLKDHDIHEVLKISLNQLMANSSYMRLTPDDAPIAPASADKVVTTMGKAFKAYQNLWGKSHFQVVLLSTGADTKVDFLQKLGKELAKNSNLKIDADLSEEFMNNGEGTKQKFCIALKNSKGHTIKEGKDLKKNFRKPRKTVTAYKLFRTLKTHPGEIFPLFIDATTPVPVGVWIPAENHPTSGYAPRPGWHSGPLPLANHLLTKEGKLDPARIWAEVEIPDDEDWQSVADESPTGDIRGEVPVNGFYRWKRPERQGGNWYISGAIKVNRILTPEEVEDIAQKASIKEDTTSAAFASEVPENMVGLVDLSSSKEHKKPIPFGGETGEEISAKSREHLAQMKKGFTGQLA